MVQALHKFIEDFRTGPRDRFAGMGVGFHPGKQENKRNPAAGAVFELRTDPVEYAREHEWQLDGDCFQDGGIEAVLGRRGYEIFPAGEGADGVDGTESVFKEGAGNAQVKIVEGSLGGVLSWTEPVIVGEAFHETGGGELLDGLAESPGEFLLLVCGKGANPFGEGLGLDKADGNRVVAAMVAALLARDWLARSSQFGGCIVDEGIIEALQQGKNLHEIGRTGRDLHGGG